MAPLDPGRRRELERAIVNARGLAEAGARAALARLGVESEPAPAATSPEQRTLRVQLRARLRAIGQQGLVEEVAYEQWHRMLFARFLAENGLLRHPEGASVTVAEVKELAEEEGERDPWVLAARYAAAMLPGIFRADDPANRVALAPEDRIRMEGELDGLPAPLFTADDALGWVYQFWQSRRKDEVNRKGDKIGGADLPPVTQLFTEHYMVRFLLENSLGAWWAGRHPDSPLLREWEYLRFRDDGTPAAGTFEGWPTRAAEVTVMDPCCGSGHFLVAAADMLRKMRMEEEGLSAAQAAAAVIADNLFGLELDARCLQLAAFNLALDAWKVGGYQPLPLPNLACSGIAIQGQRADWHRLAGDDESMRHALDRLYDLFQDAPELGSLIDPRSAAGEGLWRVDPDELLAKLERALEHETATNPAAAVFGAAAAGAAGAAWLLSRGYCLVATNPPFLGRRHQGDKLMAFANAVFPDSRNDLMTMMLDRWSRFAPSHGAVAFVTPQSWTTLGNAREFRREWLDVMSPRVIARLGPRAFEEVTGEVVKTGLVVAGRERPAPSTAIAGLDCSHLPPREKARCLAENPVLTVDYSSLLNDPDRRLVVSQRSAGSALHDLATVYKGLTTGDDAKFRRAFWEPATNEHPWLQSGAKANRDVSGHTHVIRQKLLVSAPPGGYRPMSASPLGKRGVAVGHVGAIRAAAYSGSLFDQSMAAIVPKDDRHLTAILTYCRSEEFERELRLIDTSVKVTDGSLVKVPFDLEHWQKVAAERYPDGLPEPHSEDPTQWLFKGDVAGSEAPLQVAVARLLGYRWPDQEPDALDDLADADGLVPLPPVGGDRSAADRLRELLARAYGHAWSPGLLERLLSDAGSPGATLEAWLRDDFFAQHSRLFHHRPFVLHVWDGRKDGFSVLCHYHRLDRARLEKLTYTLLGDWIERQRAAAAEPGAEARLVAALALREKLERILEGEAPYDVYVRWKPLAEQPIGWEPDLDDGVRLNIRPFVTAGVLRARVNVKWGKDRGRDPDGSERINDRHPTLAEKRAARAQAGVG